MAKKHISIEVFDVALETVTTSGGVTVVQYGNMPNTTFADPLYVGNIGLAGCSLQWTWLTYNIQGGNGIPTDTHWKGAAYDSTAAPSAGLCVWFYRNTPLPTISGGKLNFTGTTINQTEYVQNGDFGVTNGGTYPGFIYMYISANVFPLDFAISLGHIGAPGANEAWYGSTSFCGDIGFGTLNPVTVLPPAINQSGAFCRLENAINSTCANTGYRGHTAIYQVIQGLTPGIEYTLKIKLKDEDSTGNGWVKVGTWWLVGGQSVGGNTYTNIGGDTSPIYGTGGLGQPNDVFEPYNTNIQTANFVAQGGNEVLSYEYISEAPNTPYWASERIEIDYISIKEAVDAPYNVSSVYTLCDVYDNNASAVATHAKIRIDVTTFNYGVGGGDAILINSAHAQYPIDGAPGLQPLVTNPIVMSNNFGFAPTHPVIAGAQTIIVPVNQTSSTGAFSANDRFFNIDMINVDGTIIELNGVQVDYEYITTAVTHESIIPEQSVLGVLEVSNSEDFPLNISYNISDGENLEATFGDYSQTFDLPATAGNNTILNSVWKASVDQKDKKMFGVKDCRVLVDGTPFFEGSMQVKNSSHTENPKSYSCTLYGGNFSWMTLLKDKKLCEVFENGDNFPFTYQEIESVWGQTQATTDIQYPLISYRDFNQGSTSWGLVPVQNYVNMFDITKSPDFQPSFYIYNIIKKIFNDIGYTINSTFIETDHFKRLLNTFPFLQNSALDDGIHYSCEQRIHTGDYQVIENHVYIDALITSWTTVILEANIDDPAQAYNNQTGVWTCQKAGQYHVTAQNGFKIVLTSDAAYGPGGSCGAWQGGACDWSWEAPSSFWDSWSWASRVKHTSGSSVNYLNTTSAGIGQTSGSPLDFEAIPYGVGCWDTSTQYTVIPPGTVQCLVGDTIELQGIVYAQHLGGPCTPKVMTWFGMDSVDQVLGNTRPEMTITFDNTVPGIGEVIDKNNILPCGVTQIDFIKSISHLFNLFFTTNVQSKTIEIEPFNEFFFNPGTAGWNNVNNPINWDMKVDYSQDVSDNYNIGLKKQLNIGYKLDMADKFAKELNFKSNIYGATTKLYNYGENLGDDFPSGEVLLANNMLASSTQVWDNDAHDNVSNDRAPVLIPNLWKEDAYSGISMGNNQWRPKDLIEGFVPRIFYYKYEYVTNVVNPGGTPTYWSRVQSDGTPFQDAQAYPRATFVDWEEAAHDVSKRPSLSFSDESFTAPGQLSVNNVPGLYSTYYKNMIEQLKRAPRIRSVYVNLKISDILRLNMRHLVYLDECWWRINRINGYSPGQNESTKVELIQWIDVGYWPVTVNNTIINYT